MLVSSAQLKISEYSEKQLVELLKAQALVAEPETLPLVRMQSDIASIARDIALMYGDFETCPIDSFADFHVAVSLESGVFGWMKPRARSILMDGPPLSRYLPTKRLPARMGT